MAQDLVVKKCDAFQLSAGIPGGPSKTYPASSSPEAVGQALLSLDPRVTHWTIDCWAYTEIGVE